MQIRTLAQDFNSVMSVKEAIGSWFYYNPDKNLVIANGDIYRSNTYFNKFFPYSRLSQERFDEMIENSSRLLIGLETQKEWMVEGSDVTRPVVPFVISYNDLIGQKALLVLNIIEEHYADCTLSLEAAAGYFYTSVSSFSRSFKEEMGATFPKYLTALRIRKARELLMVSPLRIDEIAAMVGISSRVAFNRLFKQSEGMPPGQFRELHQGAGRQPPDEEE